MMTMSSDIVQEGKRRRSLSSAAPKPRGLSMLVVTQLAILFLLLEGAAANPQAACRFTFSAVRGSTTTSVALACSVSNTTRARSCRPTTSPILSSLPVAEVPPDSHERATPSIILCSDLGPSPHRTCPTGRMAGRVQLQQCQRQLATEPDSTLTPQPVRESNCVSNDA